MSFAGFGSLDADADVCTALSFGEDPDVSSRSIFKGEVELVGLFVDVDVVYDVLCAGFDFRKRDGGVAP